MMSIAAASTLSGIKLGALASVYADTELSLIAYTFTGIKLMAVTTYLFPLAGGIFMGGIILLTSVLIFPRLLGDEVIGILGRFSPRLSQAFCKNTKLGSKKIVAVAND